ncbi:MAG: TIGR00725 family protein [Candidatus Omnitrophica bacterium]|nr:TIGR00725 family protein [Candidatus Omnitrophota bacterium]MBU1128888.1 TIGR00725 family protein [Candidatus Omnitrophota bacterium]MBU1783846.1 TIGR00725 family protein [Candidatus Omnitrophota bacterium]MBU1851567.1 TIGR00725 family protein [Candidatus Omnitrophota bacterium]
MRKRKFLVAVIGGHKCGKEVSALAEQVGKVVADAGAVVVCGGLGGIMEAVSRGAKEAGGLTIGIIPGNDKNKANRFVDIVLPTDMGFSRNTFVAGAGDLVVALPGELGTLSEISFALIGKKPVFGFNTWDIEGVVALKDIGELKAAIERNMAGGK